MRYCIGIVRNLSITLPAELRHRHYIGGYSFSVSSGLAETITFFYICFRGLLRILRRRFKDIKFVCYASLVYLNYLPFQHRILYLVERTNYTVHQEPTSSHIYNS